MSRDFSTASQQLGRAATAIKAGDNERRAGLVQSVQQQIDAIARGDLESALGNAHPELDLEIFAPPEFPWIRRARGVAAIRDAIEHNFGSLEHQTPTIENVVTELDTVVLFGREHGIIRATAAPYEVHFVQRFTFEDGRLRSVRIVAARSGPSGG